MRRLFGVLLCVMTLVGAQDVSAKPSSAISVYVDATVQGWQSTGVVLNGGHSVSITANGTACIFDDYCMGPDGTGDNFLEVEPYLNAPWVGGPAYALVGMVGGDMVFIGSGPTLVSGSGELFLTYNDDRVNDNSGGYDVSITSCRPGKGKGDTNHCHTGAPGQA